MALRLAALSLLLAGLLAVAHAAAPGPRDAHCSGCHAPHLASTASCTHCHAGNPATRRPALAHERLLAGAAAAWDMPGHAALAAGERLREQLGCRRCHVSGGRGNALAQSLDEIAWTRSPAELRRALLAPSSFMPDFSLDSTRADTLIAVLLRDARGLKPATRYLVRFREPGAAAGDVFTRRCGDCHRALTAAGALGASASGPNLSGLLTPFYPTGDGSRWDRARLERWLANPRAVRPEATMRPVRLEPGELDEILTLLGGTRAPE